MTPGANDSRFFRRHGVPAYGWRPFAALEGDRERSHGANERLAVAAIRPGLELYTNVLLELVAER
jgi:acetylornithine deacetylase/succinyl-diaminopimelate desuccinylase-like protein